MKELTILNLRDESKRAVAKSSAFFLTLILSSCGAGSQTEEREAIEVQKDNGETSTQVSDVGVAGSLAISSGPAAGTKIDFPANSFPQGTEVSAKATGTPSEFSGLSSSAKPASAAVEIKALGTSGEVTSVASPMTLALPLGQLSLGLVESTNENLCALLKAAGGKGLFVWRAADLDVDTSENLVKLSTLYLGIFQLVYCGNEALPGFKEASAEGANTQLLEFPITFDRGAFLPGSEVVCLSMFGESKDGDAGDIGLVLATSSMPSSNVYPLKVSSEAIDDWEKLHIVAARYPAGFECKSGISMTEALPPVEGVIIFTKTPDELRAAAGVGFVIGDADHPLGLTTTIIGVPSNASISAGSPKPVEGCAIYSDEGKGAAAEYSFTIDAKGLINGKSMLEVSAPNSATSVSYKIGAKCFSDSESSVPTTDHYSAVLADGKFSFSNSNYLVPVSLKVTTPQALTAIAQEIQVCLDLRGGGELTEAGQPIDPSIESISKIAIETAKEYQLYIPWNHVNKNAQGIPLYDLGLNFGEPYCSNTSPNPLNLPVSSTSITNRPLTPQFSN